MVAAGRAGRDERNEAGKRKRKGGERRDARKSTRWRRDESTGPSERRMADRNEDFNWYPLRAARPARGPPARSFCYCFFLVPFSLSFRPSPPHAAAHKPPASSKTIYRGHSGEAALGRPLFVRRGTFTEIAAKGVREVTSDGCVIAE